MRSIVVRIIIAAVALNVAVGATAIARLDTSEPQRLNVEQGSAPHPPGPTTSTRPAPPSTSTTTAAASDVTTTVPSTALTPASSDPSAADPQSTPTTSPSTAPAHFVPPTTGPTTIAPSSSPTAPPGSARISVRNDFDVTVRVNVSDQTSNEWVLAPGAAAGPWDMETSSVHGDGAGVTRTDSPCGGSDSENYFLDGHEYLLQVSLRNPAKCPDGRPSPLLVIHDLTTGGTRQI